MYNSAIVHECYDTILIPMFYSSESIASKKEEKKKLQQTENQRRKCAKNVYNVPMKLVANNFQVTTDRGIRKRQCRLREAR